MHNLFLRSVTKILFELSMNEQKTAYLENAFTPHYKNVQKLIISIFVFLCISKINLFVVFEHTSFCILHLLFLCP